MSWLDTPQYRSLSSSQKWGLGLTSVFSLVFVVSAIALVIWVIVKGKSSKSAISRVSAETYSDPRINTSAVRDQFPAGPTAPAQDGNDMVSQRYTFQNFREAAMLAPTVYMRPEMQGDGLSKLGERWDYRRWLETEKQLEGEMRANGSAVWNEFDGGQSAPVTDAYSVVLDSNVNRQTVSPSLVRLSQSEISTSDEGSASRAISQITQAQLHSQSPLPISDTQLRAMQHWVYSRPGSEPAKRIAAMKSSLGDKLPLPL